MDDRSRLVPAEVDEGSVPVSRAKNRPRSSRSRSRPSDCGRTTRSLRRASNSSRGSSPPQPLILVLIDETRTEDYAVESWTARDVEFATAGWVDWYNIRRVHGPLGMLTPGALETIHDEAINREPESTK